MASAGRPAVATEAEDGTAPVLGTYQRYKTATKRFLSWTRKQLKTHQRKASGPAKPIKLDTCQGILDGVEQLAGAKTPVPLSVAEDVRCAIALRTRMTNWLGSQQQPTSSDAEGNGEGLTAPAGSSSSSSVPDIRAYTHEARLKQDEGHRHFVRVLKECYRKILPLTAKVGPHPAEGDGSDKSVNRFAVLSLGTTDDTEGGEGEEEEEEGWEEESESSTLEAEEMDWRALVGEEEAFALSCFMLDWQLGLEAVRKVWREAKRGEVTLEAAAAVTSAAVRVVMRNETELGLMWPEHEGTTMSQRLPALLLTGLLDMSSPGGRAISAVEMCLNSFATAMGDNFLSVKEGYFGARFDESTAQGRLDPSRPELHMPRLVLYELQGLYNVHLSDLPARGGTARCSSGLEGVEAAEDMLMPLMREYFKRRGRPSPPLAFATLCWWESCVAMQGRCGVGRAAAMVPRLADDIRRRLERRSAADLMMHMPALDLGDAKEKEVRLRKSIQGLAAIDELYRYNPWVAGRLLLKMRCLFLNEGLRVLNGAPHLQAVAHIYRALRLTGKEPIPELEHVICRFFNPVELLPPAGQLVGASPAELMESYSQSVGQGAGLANIKKGMQPLDAAEDAARRRSDKGRVAPSQAADGMLRLRLGTTPTTPPPVGGDLQTALQAVKSSAMEDHRRRVHCLDGRMLHSRCGSVLWDLLPWSPDFMSSAMDPRMLAAVRNEHPHLREGSETIMKTMEGAIGHHFAGKLLLMAEVGCKGALPPADTEAHGELMQKAWEGLEANFEADGPDGAAEDEEPLNAESLYSLWSDKPDICESVWGGAAWSKELDPEGEDEDNLGLRFYECCVAIEDAGYELGEIESEREPGGDAEPGWTVEVLDRLAGVVKGQLMGCPEASTMFCHGEFAENPTLLHQLAGGTVAHPGLLEWVLMLGAHDTLCLQSRTAGDTPAHVAAAAGSVECYQVLHRADPLLRLRVNTAGETPLHCAAREGQNAMVTYLLWKVGADPTAKDAQGRTPAEVVPKGAKGRGIAKFLGSMTGGFWRPNKPVRPPRLLEHEVHDFMARRTASDEADGGNGTKATGRTNNKKKKKRAEGRK